MVVISSWLTTYMTHHINPRLCPISVIADMHYMEKVSQGELFRDPTLQMEVETARGHL